MVGFILEKYKICVRRSQVVKGTQRSDCYKLSNGLLGTWQVVASGVDEKTLKREGVCAASLPTTMVSITSYYGPFRTTSSLV